MQIIRSTRPCPYMVKVFYLGWGRCLQPPYLHDMRATAAIKRGRRHGTRANGCGVCFRWSSCISHMKKANTQGM